MRRIGNAGKLLALFALVVSGVAAAAADQDFYQTVDRAEVGTEDTLRLSIVIVNADGGAQLTPPDLDDFEVLSRTPVDSTSIQITGNGSQIQRVRKWVYVLRPKRAGTLTIGPSKLTGSGSAQKTDSIQITVKKGHIADPNAQAQRRRPDPFHDFFGSNFPSFPPGFDDDDDPFGGAQFPDEQIPTSDSDLFIRTYVDQKEAYLGEQVTMSVYVFSRVELSSVDSVNLPKLEGFWSEDIDSPTQLSGESRIINGIPYRAYLLKRKALFPLKSGTLEIDPVQADITTGYLFAGKRIHRAGNKVALKVKPLPPGAPSGFATTNVGRWQLEVEATPQDVKLGDPITVRVTLEGKGNVKNVAPPKLEVPPSFKVYDPTTTDKVATRNGVYGGRRVQEYLVMPQQTGTFTLPALSFPYFDPNSRTYQTARTEPITLHVEAGVGGVASIAPGNANGAGAANAAGPKNVLTADAIQPPRHAADFSRDGVAMWKKPWFVPAVLSPFAVWAALGVLGLVRSRVGKEDETSLRKRKAREARKRLQAAEALRQAGSAEAFYAEVEKALIGFLEARLGEPVGGLTREALTAKLTEHGIPAEKQKHVLTVLETCELGRYAPGAADPAARDRVLDDAEAAMEAFEA